MPPFTPTAQQKVEAVPHVRYEIESLLLTPAHDPANKSLVEAVYMRKLVHGRVLYSFFSPPKKDRPDDDVYSIDFGFRSKELYGVERERLRDEFNKRIFHLTYNREHRPWQTDELLLPVIRQARIFIGYILDLRCTVITIPESELENWRKLQRDDAAGSPLQQNTTNVANIQTATIII